MRLPCASAVWGLRALERRATPPPPAVAAAADALLFSALSFAWGAPVVHPALRQRLQGHRPLVGYVERLSEQLFSQAAPQAAEVELQWTQWEPRSQPRGAG